MRTIWSFSAAVVLALSSWAAGDVKLTIKPALAPSMYASPSWSAFADNAITALKENRDSVSADAQNPTGFQVVQGVELAHILVGPFPLWKGQLAPAGTFAAEHGNRVHFALHAQGNGQRFALADIAYSITSGDPGQLLSQSGTLADLAYSASRVGVSYGSDGKRGGGDDVVFQDGEPGTIPVDELFYVGIGVGAQIDERTASKPEAERVAHVLKSINTDDEFSLAVQYTIRGSGGATLGQGRSEITVTPPPGEPSPLPVFIGVGAALLVVGGMFAYKKNRRGPVSVADKF
jgi:hypothetical protein